MKIEMNNQKDAYSSIRDYEDGTIVKFRSKDSNDTEALGIVTSDSGGNVLLFDCETNMIYRDIDNYYVLDTYDGTLVINN